MCVCVCVCVGGGGGGGGGGQVDIKHSIRYVFLEVSLWQLEYYSKVITDASHDTGLQYSGI